MDVLCLGEEFSCIPATDFHDAGLKNNLFWLQLSSSVSMDDIFSRLLTLTSYLTDKLIQLIGDVVLRDVRGCSEDLVVNSCDQEVRCSYRGDSAGTSTSSRYWDLSNCFGFPGNTDSEPDDLTVYSRSQIVQSNYSSGSITFVLKGLMLCIFGLRFARTLVLTSWRLALCYIRCVQAKVLSFISRVRRTLHGSSDDIGWLQNETEMAPVVDGSARFLELLLAVRNGEHTLPDSFVYLLIPGLFSNHGPLYFVSVKRAFSKMGLACHIAKIHSEASVEHNAWELKQYIEELYWGSGKRLMLLGHSKGGVDAAAALSIYQDDLEDKVAGLAFVQSPYGGTPVAADVLREGQIADKETRRTMEFIICKLIKGNIRALEDLTYDKRKEFIRKHKLPDNIPLISFHSEANMGPGVFATMSHIAHAELPWFPLPHFGPDDSTDAWLATRSVPVILPVSAVLAVCALHLQLRYGEKSDGLVTCCDAEVPGSVVVKPNTKLDHSWIVYSSWKKKPREPDCAEMCEALLTQLVELGKQKQDQVSWK
ncbi:hypothetical protein ACH5RR_004164 [Cinchona calisaya]|uniref:Alpha/beta-Hydrolases superfamily protein n=1 Tax=Cinchona calisaya TaxID=153742 RepID=A0ABD3AWU9_9GENT